MTNDVVQRLRNAIAECEETSLEQAALEEIERLTRELDAIKRTREQEKDYADTCYENERLKELVRDLCAIADPEKLPAVSARHGLVAEGAHEPIEPRICCDHALVECPLHGVQLAKSDQSRVEPKAILCSVFHPWAYARCELPKGHAGPHGHYYPAQVFNEWPAVSR